MNWNLLGTALLAIFVALFLGREVYWQGEENGEEKAQLMLGDRLPTEVLPNGNIRVDNGGGQQFEFIAPISPGVRRYERGYDAETIVNEGFRETYQNLENPQPAQSRRPKSPVVHRSGDQTPAQSGCGTQANPCGDSGQIGFVSVPVERQDQ